jgi:hypothetical protein
LATLGETRLFPIRISAMKISALPRVILGWLFVPLLLSTVSAQRRTSIMNENHAPDATRADHGGHWPALRPTDSEFGPPSRPWTLPVYYPPTPPVLGSPIPLQNPLLLPKQHAPEALEDFVNELFYPALGTRLAQNKINPRLREKINAYRAAKIRLQDELRSRLSAVRHLDSATRREELAAFAKTQAPQLAALEKTAEQLRDELVRGDFFQSSADWTVTRDWRLGKSLFASAPDAITAQLQVMRGAAFYQRGLLPEQRGLLREIAIELKEANPRANVAEGLVAPPLFFSPATARIRLPPGLPAELHDKIARYEQEKSVIKQELRDVVYAQDKAFFSVSRLRPLEALAERQWPRLAALEELAEEIRRELAYAPNPIGPPDPPPVSAALAARLTNYLATKQKVETDVLAKIGQLKQRFSIQRISSGSTTGDLRLVLSPGQQTEEQMNLLRTTLDNFNREVASRQSDLRKELAVIRREFAREANPREGESLEDLLYNYAIALQQRDEWLLYDDYKTAVLMPGLSPEQRRLLYDAGVRHLDLPLPGWELAPIRVVQ